MLIYGLNKEMKFLRNQGGRKKEAGGVRDFQQGAMPLTQNLERGIGLNHTHHPPLIILLPASIFSQPLQTKKGKKETLEIFSVFSRTLLLYLCSVWGLGIKHTAVLQSCNSSNALLYIYMFDRENNTMECTYYSHIHKQNKGYCRKTKICIQLSLHPVQNLLLRHNTDTMRMAY